MSDELESWLQGDTPKTLGSLAELFKVLPTLGAVVLWLGVLLEDVVFVEAGV